VPVSRSRYFVCLYKPPGRGRAQPPQVFDPYAEASLPDITGPYWSRVLQAFDREAGDRGLTVYLTWDLYELPSYGREVVAISTGDESAMMPRWADRVGAAFKVYGTRPWLERNPLREPSRLAALTFARYVRSWARRLPGSVAAPRGSRRPVRVDQLPLGYSNQLDLPVKPPGERTTDAFFAGSVEHRAYRRLSPARWMGTPKQIARAEMLAALARYRAARPGTRIDVRLTTDYWTSIHDDAAEYSNALMDARICLAPRGANVETFRLFEGLRYGCVVVGEPLPDTWYYRGAPIVQLRRWREIGAILDDLLADPAEVEQRHRAALAFWDERCSEAAVARFILDRLPG
jgi:hypothetical protein